MYQSAISFTANGLELEGIVAKPDKPQSACPMVVLCNAHPGLFGALNNTLMDSISKVLVQADIATLRFNYRGIGGSQGAFTNGEREAADVAAAVQLANGWPGIKKGHVGVLGYSFGAGVLLRSPEKLKGVRAAVLIAPPVSSFENAPLLRERFPKLFILGEQDKVAPPERIKDMLAQTRGNLETRIVLKVNHSWRGGESETALQCADFLFQHIR